jgi:hypothetical protein
LYLTLQLMMMSHEVDPVFNKYVITQIVFENLLELQYPQQSIAGRLVTMPHSLVGGLPLRQFSSFPTRQAFAVRLAGPEIDSNNPSSNRALELESCCPHRESIGKKRERWSGQQHGQHAIFYK